MQTTTLTLRTSFPQDLWAARARAALILLAGLLATPLAQAAAGDDDRNFFRVGLERVIFHDQNTGFVGPGIPASVHLETEAQNLNTIYFAYARGLTPHLELELVGGVPGDYRANARGMASLGSVPYNGERLVTLKVATPGFTLNYKFNEPGDFYRPYLGAGLAYTHFYNIQGTPQGDAITGGPTKITFTDSLGLLLTAGVSFRIGEHWRAHASMSKADVRPDVTTETAGVKRINHVDLGPIVYLGMLSYGF
jgi:outer membrane protein